MQGNTVLIGSLNTFLHQTCPIDVCWLARLHSLLAAPLWQARYTGCENAVTCWASLMLKRALQYYHPNVASQRLYFTISLDCFCLQRAQQKDVLLHRPHQNGVRANAILCLYTASGSGITASEHYGWLLHCR